MDYVCPVCGAKLSRELTAIIPHTEKHIINEIKKKNPHWAEKDGACRKCYDYYKKQMNKSK